MKLDPTSPIALFTDGSSDHRDRSGGYAWIAIDSSDGEESGSGSMRNTTNNRMEMQAVIEGLQSLYDNLGPSHVLIYSDSDIVVKGFNKEFQVKHNMDLWKKIWNISALHKSVSFNWVKGHSKSLYNHEADKLAKKARKEMNEKEN